MAPSVIGYVWEESTGRFRAPNGRFLSVQDVRKQLDFALAGSANDAKLLADAYNSGVITLAEFETQMQELIKATQIYSTAVASGGFAQVGAAEVAKLDGELRTQYAYLSDWADDLASGVVRTASHSRAAMYAKAARGTFHDIYGLGQGARGITQDRTILQPGAHCGPVLGQSGLGWVEL